MKKIYIACAVLATAALTSCLQEQSFNDVKLGENDVVFTFQGAASTKAAEAPVTKGVSFPLGKEGSHAFTLEETVIDLNTYSPVTKGTPAYTENVGTLYENDLSVYAVGGNFPTTDETFENMDGDRVNGGWRYRHTYNADPWPTEDAVDFYLQMPVTQPGVTMTSRTGGAFSFSYASKAKAEEQKDILFAYRSLTKEEHNGYLPYGAPVLFHHALTGVKFRIYNDADDLEGKGIVRITSVSFKGVKTTGNCVVTPRKEAQPGKPVVDEEGNPVVDEEGNPTTEPQDSAYIDNRTSDYSSGDGTTVIWSNRGGENTMVWQDFGENDLQDFTANDGNNFAPSFYEAGQTQNLNTANASYTFWMVPQDFSGSTATLVIEFVITDGINGQQRKEIEIDFGTALDAANVEWKPGQLRTYSIRIDEVNVKIEDHVTMATQSTQTITDDAGREYTAVSFKGSTKQDVVITNTGDTDAYIRAAIIGQWLDGEGNPVFGFTDFTKEKVVIVDSWYQDQFVSKKRTHGKFLHLPGYDTATNTYHNWLYNEADGYYYYKNVVPAEQKIPVADSLFTKYTVGDSPAVAVAGAVKNVYFELEISTQAISANKSDGTHYSLSDAWKRAGVTTLPEE